jgi:N,N'-diacetyllegionaminate synthase
MENTLIIAEAGVNHNGSMEIAKKLIDAAASAGVDYVKFQSFKTDKLVSRIAKKADYQLKNTEDSDNTQYSMLKKLELSPDQHFELINFCTERGVKFFSTAFDLESIDFLSTLHLGLWKIPSGEITNFPYLKRIALKHEPVILSTGMCEMQDIENALSVLTKNGVRKDQITILHCNTEYPTPMEDVNLNAMKTIADKFDVKVGYSDHTKGIEVAIAAVALGACVIEKHFTLDRNMEGPDHKASIEPDDLKAMVSAIRNIEKALGSEEKRVSSSEQKNISIARKSIVAATIIQKGELLTELNLTVKRPGTGLSPMLWESVVGSTAKKAYQPDDLIEL